MLKRINYIWLWPFFIALIAAISRIDKIVWIKQKLILIVFFLFIKFLFLKVDFDKIIQSYLNEDYINNIYNELAKEDNSEWLTPGIKALFQLAFHIFILVLNGFINETGIYIYIYIYVFMRGVYFERFFSMIFF